ncbi:MAG: endonuclease domain-containing protein [Candidatus Buchananbacteria bacterium]
MKNRLVKLARILRKNQTPYESKLWCLLRDKRLEGLKFRRQYPIGIYIVDFCCFEKKLIIELDGGHHNQNEQIKNDQKRDQYLINQGYKILRFWNNDLDNNIEGVIEKILISL